MNADELAAILARKGYSIASHHPKPAQLRGHRELQKLKDDRAGKAHHKPKKAKGNGQLRQQFRIRFAFRISDLRNRDPDGMQSSILDALIRARRRLLEKYPDE